jgi:uncharacterized membrane protein
MAKKKRITKTNNLSKEDDRKLFAFLATFLSIIGFLIALIARRNDRYVMYYAKHSLVIFVVMIIAGVIGKVFLLIPIAGDIINVALVIISVLLWLLSWVYALSGKEKSIPIVTEWANKIDL